MGLRVGLSPCYVKKVIDVNYDPVIEAHTCNMRHRIHFHKSTKLADAFILINYPFESDDMRKLNKNIFETSYFAAMETSMEIVRELGPYETFAGSPASKGIFHFDMWRVTPSSGLWDWKALKEKVMKYGIRNSLLVAPMPTASTAQILGNNESIEPYTSNISPKPDLHDGGSVQQVKGIPNDVKEKYKTGWAIKQKAVLDLSVDRGAYICQIQSLSIHIADPTIRKLTSIHFYAWKKGLRTSMDYLRGRPEADASSSRWTSKGWTWNVPRKKGKLPLQRRRVWLEQAKTTTTTSVLCAGRNIV
ncbi:hypothetical protein PsorP6_007127 [Peronosclerospora sorghi]|uniref:Uncharacterized protein n=1 Tax=Peronosclerospora sorghi TaxID=230839 RepID=A0ACC0W9G6_9STRA|nr:hypothetical protein PsorP6_007127 [Peronosclerospora sorghi]